MHGTGLEGCTMLKAKRRSLNSRWHQSSATSYGTSDHELHPTAYVMINFRVCGKEFVSNNDLYIFIIKKGINAARLDWFAVTLVKNNLEIPVINVNIHTLTQQPCFGGIYV